MQLKILLKSRQSVTALTWLVESTGVSKVSGYCADQ